MAKGFTEKADGLFEVIKLHIEDWKKQNGYDNPFDYETMTNKMATYIIKEKQTDNGSTEGK